MDILIGTLASRIGVGIFIDTLASKLGVDTFQKIYKTPMSFNFYKNLLSPNEKPGLKNSRGPTKELFVHLSGCVNTQYRKEIYDV